MNTDIFEPFEQLVEIEISGEIVKVPESNTLLRCFQYLSMESVSYGDFCWNGDCANCRIRPENTEKEKSLLACRTKAREGMKIVQTSEKIKITKNE